MASLLENNRDAEDIFFIVLGEGLFPETVHMLTGMVKKYGRRIFFPDTTELIERMKAWGIPPYRGSYAAGMRMFFPMLLPGNGAWGTTRDAIDRIIYIDADTVVEGSLSGLAGMDLQGKSLGMVLDSLCGQYKKEIGVGSEEPYYNSGVILFDTGAWLEKKYTERIVDFLVKEGGQFTNPDQDLLNIVCKGDIFTLPPVYNVQPIHMVFSPDKYFTCYSEKGYYGKRELCPLYGTGNWQYGKEAAEDRNGGDQRAASTGMTEECLPVIFHFLRFIGEYPWDEGNIHPDRERYRHYLAFTPWKDKPEDRPVRSLAFRIEKILYRILPGGIFLWIFSIAHRRYLKKQAEIGRECS